MWENKEKQQDLIEYIAQKTGCDYISDLHDKSKNAIIAHILKEISAEEYTLNMWKDASEYLLEKKERLSTAQEIRDDLIKNLEHPLG